jgi:RIO kinase 2
MKLDPTVMPTMQGQDFRVLEAVEKGMQQHSLVPAPLIASVASLRHGGTGKILSSLLRDKLLSHDKSCGYDGYRLTNAGYDILALHDLKTRKLVAAFGDRIGTGKESDIYLAVSPNGEQVVLKFHRLGRTSFRNVKKTRDYFVYQGKRGTNTDNANQGNSWLFLSRKSALKEFAFMKALYNVDYPTPKPLGHNRHVIVMSLVRGVPLYQIRPQNLSPEQAACIFNQAADLAVRLAHHGLVHCDLNEFNLLVDMSGIQQTAMSQEHDPYVRHSGMSVVAESNPGMLSARGPWEPERLQSIEPDAGSHTENEPPKAVELLDNGEPKPIVTLIDFPQMVSTQHPNAKELYERDTACLFKFFSHKLQFQIPESEREKLHLTWESIQEILKDQQQLEDENQGDDGQSVCLASKAQLRLDQELQASGYSKEDSNRDMELYYYKNNDDPNDGEGQDGEGQDGEGQDGEGQDDEAQRGDLEKISEDAERAASSDGANGEEERSTGALEPSSVVSQQHSVTIEGAELLTEMTRQQLQELARVRVQQQLEAQKKKNRTRGAFHKRNSNKSYVKGKRVFEDIGLQ